MGPPENPLKRLVHEIHHRSLWQVLAIYVAASWIVFEVVQTLTEGLGLPDWFPAFAFVLLLIGLPIVLATSFVQHGGPGIGSAASPFDLDEVFSEGEAEEEPGPRGLRALFTWRNAFLGGVGAFALFGMVAVGWFMANVGDRGVDAGEEARPAIAILPLENLSPDPDDVYFADGVHEEILTQLTKIAGLRVISRTSVMGYRETTKNMRQIAAELGARYILEGSVQRFADRVRITAQLVDAEDDEHLWAESYERDREDLFAIQADVAEHIAAALETELTPAERARLGTRLTENSEAHDHYLRAKEYDRAGENAGRREGGQAWSLAVQMYRSAAELDPEFAAAWAGLSYQHLRLHWYGYDRTEARRDSAKVSLDRALALDPDLPEVIAANGYWYYWGLRDYEQAAAEYERALQELPGDAQLRNLLGYVKRRKGRLLEAAEHMAAGFELDPLNGNLAVEAGNTFRGARAWEPAEHFLNRATALSPDLPDGYTWKAQLYVSWRGDNRRARETLEAGRRVAPPADFVEHLYRVDMMERRWEAALERVETDPRENIESQYELLPVAMLAGFALVAMGEGELARERFRTAVAGLERLRTERPADYRVYRALGLAYAALGRTEEAATAANRAVEMLPMRLDAWVAGSSIEDRAWTYTLIGEAALALDDLEFLIATPSRSWVTSALLRIDPRWDALRDDPRFQALVDEDAGP